MKQSIQIDGRRIQYEYDETQDMLYITFTPHIGATYYTDADELDGVMLRYDGESEQLVGITVHNVASKLLAGLVDDLVRRFLLPQAIQKV